jgi:hypothetical protein
MLSSNHSFQPKFIGTKNDGWKISRSSGRVKGDTIYELTGGLLIAEKNPIHRF